MAMPFDEWLPDTPDFPASDAGGGGITIAQNVIPESGGYLQVKSFANTITALAARVQGAIAVKNAGGGAYVYAGTAATLQQLGPGGSAFTNLSKAGGYNCSADEQWSFVRYAGNVYGANIGDEIQVQSIGAAALFADLKTGVAPKARRLAVWNNFIVAGNLVDPSQSPTTQPSAVHWCSINAPDTWPTPGGNTAIQGQSDIRILPDGGAVTGLTGGELGGYVVCETKIYRALYGDPSLFFDIQPVEQNRGSRYPGSIGNDGRLLFFINDSGIWMFDGIQSVPIGTQKVDRWFLADLDQINLPRLCNAIDPVNKLVMWAYPGAGNVGGNPTKILVYNWAINRFSYIVTTLEYLFSGMGLGYTLDGLDALGYTLDTLPYSLDSYVWQGGNPQIMGFDTSHRMGAFTGAALQATLTTGEDQLSPGMRSLLTSCRPLVSNVGTDVTITPIYRTRQQDATTTGAASSVNAVGQCPMMVDSVYFRFQADITGGFSHAQGVDPTFAPSGAY